MSGLFEGGKEKQISPWKKPLIVILAIMIFLSLLLEISFASITGYETTMHGKFEDGLYIEGDIDYDFTSLVIKGEQWVANFSNLSSIYIKYSRIGNLPFEKILNTSNVIIKSSVYGDQLPHFNINKLTNISKFNSASFSSDLYHLVLSSSPDYKITGTMNTDPIEDDLVFDNVIFITDNETIEVHKRGWFNLYGKDEGKFQFNITVDEDCIVSSTPEKYNEDHKIIKLDGKLSARNFDGSIISNGKLYFTSNPVLKGKMKLKIIHNGDIYYNHDMNRYEWELLIEGEDVRVEGIGLPFWSIGLMISAIPVTIIAFFELKQKKRNKENVFQRQY